MFKLSSRTHPSSVDQELTIVTTQSLNAASHLFELIRKAAAEAEVERETPRSVNMVELNDGPNSISNI